MKKQIKYVVVFERQASACLSASLDDRGIDADRGVFGFSSYEGAREFLDIVVRAAADEAGVLLDSTDGEVRVGFDRYESGLVSIEEIKLLW